MSLTMLHYRMAEQGRFRLKDRRTPSPGTAQHHPIRLRTSVKRSVRCRRQTVGMDPKDRTLWVAGGGNPPFVLEQYSTSGKYLQSWMVPGLPPDIYLVGDFASTGTPEPAPAALFAAGVMMMYLLRRRK